MMMAFGGTNQKCRACEETVYFVDKLTADSRICHKSCFRCHHCRGTLKLSNFNSFEGVLYCRPHFDQLLKRTGGSLDKSFEGTPKIVKSEKPFVHSEVAGDGSAYHKSCFKCTYGGCVISPSNYIAHEGRLYCYHHHIQLYKEKGNYSQLENEHEKPPPVPQKFTPPTQVAAQS